MTRLMGIKLEFISILYEERNVKLTNRERGREEESEREGRDLLAVVGGGPRGVLQQISW